MSNASPIGVSVLTWLAFIVSVVARKRYRKKCRCSSNDEL